MLGDERRDDFMSAMAMWLFIMENLCEDPQFKGEVFVWQRQ